MIQCMIILGNLMSLSKIVNTSYLHTHTYVQRKAQRNINLCHGFFWGRRMVLRQQKSNFHLHCVCFCIGLFNQAVLKSKTEHQRTERRLLRCQPVHQSRQCITRGLHPPNYKDRYYTLEKHELSSLVLTSRHSVGVRDQCVP